MAVKALKSIDWDGMAKLIGDHREFANLLRAFNEVNSTLQTKFSQEPKHINWEYYRKGIGTCLVDVYKEAYKSLAVTFSRFQGSVQIFFAVLFWLSLFFWASVWDERNNDRPNKGSRFRR
ncbi:hypothetical protein L1049_009109 [Liquidambar formosana]|uniref:ATP synthase subunit d, mitochondrial n=1 Tax=Liquidambar formosana TaxID=63359 RepID=A0AAP0SAR0_LIQFO